MDRLHDESSAARVLALTHAMQTLEREGLGTYVVFTRIRNRLREVLGENPDLQTLISSIYEQAVKSLGSGGSDINVEAEVSESEAAEPEATEPQKRQIPEIPQSIKITLSMNQFSLVNALLENYGKDIVTTQDLVRAIWNEEMDTSIPDDENNSVKKLRTLVCATRRKLEGWAKISSKKRKGYYIELV